MRNAWNVLFKSASAAGKAPLGLVKLGRVFLGEPCRDGDNGQAREEQGRREVSLARLHFSAITAVATEGGNGCWRVSLKPDSLNMPSSSENV